MPLPMDNIFFRFFLQCWPVLVAVVITIVLLYQWMRPKVTPEKLQKGIVRQSVLLAVEDSHEIENDSEYKEWLQTRDKMKKYFNNNLKIEASNQKIDYRSYTSLSLIWILFWVGALIFIALRILFNPFYYGHEAVFLGYFAYYIIIGLISFFRR